MVSGQAAMQAGRRPGGQAARRPGGQAARRPASQAPVADFYKGMPNMIAVAGNPEKALEVAAEAMDVVASRKSRSRGKATRPGPEPR